MRQVRVSLVVQGECLKPFPSWSHLSWLHMIASCGKSWLFLSGCRYSPGPAASTSPEPVWGRISEVVQGRNLLVAVCYGRRGWQWDWALPNADLRRLRPPQSLVSQHLCLRWSRTVAHRHWSNFTRSQWSQLHYNLCQVLEWCLTVYVCGELAIEMMLKHQGDLI